MTRKPSVDVRDRHQRVPLRSTRCCSPTPPKPMTETRSRTRRRQTRIPATESPRQLPRTCLPLPLSPPSPPTRLLTSCCSTALSSVPLEHLSVRCCCVSYGSDGFKTTVHDKRSAAAENQGRANRQAFELQPVVPRSWLASLHPPLLFAALTAPAARTRAGRTPPSRGRQRTSTSRSDAGGPLGHGPANQAVRTWKSSANLRGL